MFGPNNKISNYIQIQTKTWPTPVNAELRTAQPQLVLLIVGLVGVPMIIDYRNEAIPLMFLVRTWPDFEGWLLTPSV